ncbi:MAG TPA: ABC transporter permease subunit [Bryobacteraceae bacterium]|nr:ABC transporter permease subunit [Bryobacteraceae bacterium]
MRVSSVRTIYKKEMLDMVRDRRTLISMVVVPIVSMPLMFFVMNRFINTAGRKLEEESVTVGIRQGDRLPGLMNALSGAGFAVRAVPDPKAGVEQKQVAAGVEPVLAEGVEEVRIYADLTRPTSQLAANKIRTALDTFKETSVRVKLMQLGVPDSVMTPFTVKRVNVAPPAKMAASFWGTILGYTVVIFMFSGAMYPAIDMTAGEKERRTLEILLSAPAGRHDVILGKLLAATSAVIVTALLSIASMVLAFSLLQSGRVGEMDQFSSKLTVDVHHAALVMLALLPLAVLAASLMIAVALFAKSFKEAQSYLTPLVILSIFPLMVGFVPMQLTPALAAVPLLNVCQSIKEIFLGEINPLAFAVMMAANIAYAALAFLAAVRIFKDERVLFRT